MPLGHSICPGRQPITGLYVIVNQKYTPTVPALEPEKTQFPGVRSAISGLRYCSPTLGRFLNQDPIAEKGGLNLYAFCGNNGVNKWDYLGMVEDDSAFFELKKGAN